MTRSRTVRAGLLCAASLSANAGAQAHPSSRPVTIHDLLTVNRPGSVQLSPDGRSVAYTVTRPDLAANRYAVDLYVVSTVPNAHPRRVRTVLKETREASLWGTPDVTLSWNPSGDALAYIGAAGKDRAELRLIRIADGRETVVLSDAKLPGGARLSPTSVLQFSPTGKQIAVLASVSAATDTSFRQAHGPASATIDWSPEPASVERNLLGIVELASGRVRVVTDATLTIEELSTLSWSPDGRQLAFSAGPASRGLVAYMYGDIYLVDAEGTAPPRRLTDLPGMDLDPVWSPDGRSIAFKSQQGTADWMYGVTLAVVPASGGAPRFVGQWLRDSTGAGLHGLRWTSTSDSIYVQSWYHLTHELFRLRVADSTAIAPRVERLSSGDRWYGNASYSADGRLAAFTIEDVATPPDVYVTALDRFAPRAVTHLNPAWDSLARPTVQVVEWRSPDDRWDLHGLLLLPSNAAPKTRLPLLTAILGGPTMVARWFGAVPNYPLVALASQGYAVFLPNSRGREGYGDAFTHAIKTEHDYVLEPMQDVLSGVDRVVALGVADTARLGVLGFSYGGTLTANLITVTDRFKTAVYGEGSPNLLPDLYQWNPGTYPLMRDMWGLENPYDSAMIATAYRETAMFRLNRVRTPVLLEAGANGAWEYDLRFFRGLQHFGVPSEYNVYPRSGHGWSELALLGESYERVTSWLDYWLQGRPYRDGVKQQQYDRWRRGTT